METNAQYFNCLCRTCMNNIEASFNDGETMSQQQWPSIFDTIEECSDLRIAELLSDAVPQIVVQPSDELPKKICTECLERLLSVYWFQKMCVQSDKEMHELLSKEQTVLKAPMLKEAIKGETDKNDAYLQPLKDLPCNNTLQNLQQPLIQEPLAEVIVPTIEPEAAQSSAADHLQDNTQLLEQCMDAQGKFEEFIKNEPNKGDKSSTEYSDGDTMHSTISVAKDEASPIEPGDQQVNVTRDEFSVFVKNEPFEDDNSNTEYSDGDTMHSIISVMKDEPTEPEDEQLNDAQVGHVANRKKYCHVCHLCSKSYKERRFLSVHLRQKHSIESKGHTCDLCNKCFRAPAFLRRHIRTHTGERPYSCSECGKSFNQKSALTQHRYIHSGDKPHECPYCPLRFNTKTGLKRHKVIHDKAKAHERKAGEKLHKCDICGKKFFLSVQLQIHILTHTGEKPFKCKYCERGFASHSILKRHLRTHLGKNIYKCNFCPLAFPLAADMRLHLTSHNNEDPEVRERNLKALQEEEAKFELKLSNERAERQSKEEQQQRKLSNKEIEQQSSERSEFTEFIQNEPIEGKKSSTGYSDGGTMHSKISVKKDEASPTEPEDQQVNVTINEPIEDDNPNTELTVPDDEQVNDALVGHVANRKKYCHVCHLCSKSYKERRLLSVHLRQKHSIESKGYTCDFCNKCFRAPAFLRRHIRTHTGERPYSCSECGKSFSQKSTLTQHLYIHSGDKPHGCPYCPLRFSSKTGVRRHKVIHEDAKGH